MLLGINKVITLKLYVNKYKNQKDMADITKCNGDNCPVKEQCYRFTADSSEYRQSWFAETPGKIVEDKFTCDMYWGQNAQSIWKQLKDITNGKDNT